MSAARRRALALGAAVAVALAVVGGVVLVRRQDGTPAGSAVGRSRPGPVLLVPGYGGDTTSLQVLAAALRAHGRQAIIVELAGDGTGDLRVQAGRLKAAADAALAQGAPSVDVIGYSAGGVTARIWAADLGGARQARRVVTLGSPHHGTDVARLGAVLAPDACPVACQQLVPDSDLLGQLDESADGPAWTSLWTTADQVVTPPDSARIDGALGFDVQAVCPDSRVEHGGLPRDPLVIGLVLRALGPTPPTAPPGPGECAAVRAQGAPAVG
jgi:triacylglycerol lipase